MWTVRVIVLVVALVLVGAAPGHAQSPREEFLLAMQALRQREPERAAALFARVYERSRVPIALYGLGLALRRLGRDEQAAQAFEEYIARADARRFGKRVARANAMLRELRPSDPPRHCALGAACIGPMLSIGLPRLFGVGLLLRASRHFAIAGELRLSPVLDYGVVELGGRSLDASLRLHPFGNAFFVALGLGFEHLAGEATYRDVRVEGEADSINLLVGGGVSGGPGWTLGFDTNLMLGLSRSPIELRASQEVPPGIDPQLILERISEEFDQRRSEPPLILQASVRLGYLF